METSQHMSMDISLCFKKVETGFGEDPPKTINVRTVVLLVHISKTNNAS